MAKVKDINQVVVGTAELLFKRDTAIEIQSDVQQICLKRGAQ